MGPGLGLEGGVRLAAAGVGSSPFCWRPATSTSSSYLRLSIVTPLAVIVRWLDVCHFFLWFNRLDMESCLRTRQLRQLTAQEFPSQHTTVARDGQDIT